MLRNSKSQRINRKSLNYPILQLQQHIPQPYQIFIQVQCMKINWKSQPSLTSQIHQLQLHQQYLHLNPLLILMSRKRPVSIKVKLKTVKLIKRNRNKQNFHLTLLRSESYFSLFLLCKQTQFCFTEIFFVYIIFICSKL